MIGTTVGSYRITHKLAEGGMGAVYVAVHDIMEREAVVKVLLPGMSTKTSMVKRFFNEARAAASIHHPGIVDVFDVGYAADGRAYIVMEKLHGETLAARLRREPMSPAKAAQVVRQLASALAAAHQRSIIHRDLKPDNVYLVPDAEVSGGERVKILDFGIAKLAVTQGGSLMTAAGAIFGTPAYMAPEQCTDAATVDHRADLYALGCILYECLTGLPPFGHGGLQLLAAHLRDQPAPPSSRRSGIGADLDGIVLQLLAKDPGHRFQTCTALADALRPLAGTMPEGFPSGQQAVMAPGALAPSAAQAFAPTVDPAAHVATGTIHSGAAGTYMDPSAMAPSQQAGRPPTAPPAVNTTHGASAGEVAHHAQSGPGDAHASGRGRLWLGLGVVAVAGAGVAIALSVGGGSKGSEENAAAPVHAGTRAVSDAGGASRALASPAAVGQHLQVASDMLAKRRWSAAAAAAKEALAVDGIVETDRTRASAIDTRARAELVNQATFISMTRADSDNDVMSLARLFAQLPADSAYHAPALAVRNRVRDAWVAPRRKEAEDNASRHTGCSTIEGYADQSRAAFPDVAAQFDVLAKSCRRRSDVTASRPAAAPKPSKPPATPAASSAPRPDVVALVRQSKQAAKSAQFAKALALCSEAVTRGAGPDAAMVCAISSCNLKRVAAARKYIALLAGGRKSMVEQICLRNGVTL